MQFPPGFLLLFTFPYKIYGKRGDVEDVQRGGVVLAGL